jgi:dodecin
MSNKIHSIAEIVGSSDKSVGDAVRNAVATASLEWFEVTEIRGAIRGSDITDFQVTLKLGFRYEKAGD